MTGLVPLQFIVRYRTVRFGIAGSLWITVLLLDLQLKFL